MKSTQSGCTIFSGLTAAYMSGQDQAKLLYGGAHDDSERTLKRINELKELTFERASLVKALKIFNQHLGCGSETLNQIERLGQAETQVVITGQQAGIYTGPLYTVYKAVTAIKLARQMEREHGVPVVPVFWIASEDHDYDEVSKFSYLQGERLKTIVLEAEHKEKASIGHVEVGERLESLTEALLDDFVDAQQMEKLIKETQHQGESLSMWFGRMMTELFKKHGLIMIDPMLDEVRKLQSEAFELAFDNRGSIIQALNKATEQVRDLGYEPGLRPVDGNTQLFYYYQGERLSLKEDEQGLYVEGRLGRHRLDEAQIRTEIKNHPEHFSTNVVLRPVFQDRLLPVIAYIGGPGEIAYYGQLRGVFNEMGMEMPIVYPRESFTVVPKSTMALMESIGLGSGDLESILCGGMELKKEELLGAADQVHIDDVLDGFIAKFDKEYGAVLEKICGINGELREMADKNNGIIHSQFEYLRDKAHRFHRKNNKDMLKQLERIGNALSPNGNLQERELGVLNFYEVMGDRFIDQLLNDLPLATQHRIIEIEL